MTTRQIRKLSACGEQAQQHQQRPQLRQRRQLQSNTKLYKCRTMKILLEIATGFCLIHLLQSTSSKFAIQAQETTDRPIVMAEATTPFVAAKQEQQSQQSITTTTTSTTTTTTTSTTTGAPPVDLDNKMTTITIFKIQKQALHNSSSSSDTTTEGQRWLIDKSESPAQSPPAANQSSSPQPLAASSAAATAAVSSTITTSPLPATVTFGSSSRTPPVLRPSIEEVASKLSRKHLNLEHDNWRLRQPSSVSLSSASSSASSSSSAALPQRNLFDDTTKLTDGSTGPSPVEAEQDVQMLSVSSQSLAPTAMAGSSSASADSNIQTGGIFSSASPKLSDGHHHEHYLHIDTIAAAVVSGSAELPKSRQTARRKKGGFFTGETYEMSQCHHYLRIYNAPSTGNNPGAPAGLYQMVSNQQLPCSCEMRSYSFTTDLSATVDRAQSVSPSSWLSCDHVQLIGGYLQPQSSNSSSDTWDMGKVSSNTATNTNTADSGPVQVTRFSQKNSGLQTLHAQKFLNLQLTNLKSIDLSDNRIRQIKMDAFHGLEMSLENLNLANNLLGDSRAISYSAQNSNSQRHHQKHQSRSELIFFTDEFNRLKKLKWLSLRNNRINQLDSTIFTKQSSSSSSSSASFIQQQQQDPSGGIKLRLEKISDSPDETATTGELVYLDLSENILKSVPSDAILSLNKLKTLNLKRNLIVQLDQQSKFPKSLKYLDLSENLIKTIRNCDLIDLPDLIELNLSHNQLSQLDKTAFLSSTAIAIATTSGSNSNKLQLTLQTNSDATATANVAGRPDESSLSSSSSLTAPNNLIVSSAVAPAPNSDGGGGSQLLASGNKDDHSKLLASENEETKSSLYQDQPERWNGVVESLSLLNGNSDQRLGQPKRRTRRDVISKQEEKDDDNELSNRAIISDEDDLFADESNLSGQFVAGQQGGQQTLADDPVRREREFNSTIRLNLAYNYFTSLPGDSLLRFPNLQQLDLSYNRIRYLDSNYLCSIYNLVDSLRELDLSGNLLALPQTNNSTATAAPVGTPSSNATVEGEPVMQSRQLNRLFGCLQKLERLSLATNRLGSSAARGKQQLSRNDDSSLDEDEFGGGRAPATSGGANPHDRLHIKFGDNYGSRHLNQLDLSDNQLRTMPLIEQVFQQPIVPLMARQRQTNGSSSSVTSDDQQQHQLNQWMASRVYLVGLNLSYNYIDRLDERDFNHLFSLRHLSFDFNRLSSLSTKLMRRFTSLDRISFDGNRLSSLEPLNELFERSIRTLRYLNLANNRLTIWPAINKVLYEGPLRHEYIQNSPSIQIDSEDKQAVPLQFALEELNLEGNLFTSANISGLFDQFAYMKSLKTLNLNQNLLNRVRSEWFKFANKNLRALSLAGNKINSIDLGSFVYNQLNELQQLNLDHNLLKELKRKTFDSLPKLKGLDLSHNFIHTINSETFNQMNSMQVLNLSNNKLTSWKCEYFSNLCNSISGNINADLSALLNVVHPLPSPALNQMDSPATDRQSVSSLIELDLSHNSLSQLRVNSISVHTKLERLNLANNKLSYIPHDLFKATILDSKTGRQIQLVSSLRELNLAHNRIQTVDNINLRPLRNLINFNLGHNELQTLGLDVVLIDGNGNQRERNIIVTNNMTNPLIDGSSSSSSDSDGSRQKHSARQSRMMPQVIGSGIPSLAKLRHLNLSNNQLTQVNQSLLHELSPFVLLNLDLSHNYLESESLPNGFYSKISGPSSNKQQQSQQQQDGRGNYDLVFTLKLESLNLSHNRLSEFPNHLLENHHISMESCDLAHNRIQMLVPNSNILIQIKSLNLEFNPLNRESNELILFEHKSARHLNLAATRLYAIKEVTQLVEQASQHYLDKMSPQQQLQSQAQKHRLVVNQTSQLDLIRSISKPIDAPYVQHLNLSSNQLVWLAANIFERMHSLRTLDLSNNQLTRLHLLTNQLAPLSASLVDLNLASNLFTSIDFTDFIQLNRLQRLDLSSLLSLQKFNCRFLSKLTALKSLRLFNFPQVRQNLNNILANLKQRNHHNQQQDPHTPTGMPERMARKLQQELLMSTIGRHCFRDEPLVLEPNQQPHHDLMKWFNLQVLELELFNAFDEDNMATGGKGTGFQLDAELAQLLGPKLQKLTLFGLNLTSLADDSLLGITGQALDLKISYTSLARLPLEQVLNGISKRTKLNLDFRNNNIQTLDVRSLQILDELQLNNQILNKGDHSSLRLASNPMRCDCQTRPLWLWLNQRWANFELPPSSAPVNSQLEEQAGGDFQSAASGSSANNWLKFSSISQTSDIKCHYPIRLRGKLAQYVNYHDLVCKGSTTASSVLAGTTVNLANQPGGGRQSRKRNETKPSLELSYYAKDGYGGDTEDETLGDQLSADYLDSDSTTDGSTSSSVAAPPVRVTKFNRFPSLIFNQTIYYLQNIPVPFISDNQAQGEQRMRDNFDFEFDIQNGVASRMGKRDGNSANLPIYPILNDQQIVNTKYSKHRPNTQQRHSSFDTLSTLKQFQPTHHHHHSNHNKQTILTDSDVYILTIMSIAMSIMSFVIIAVCLFKYKMDRSDKERILTDHGKMLMSQALFSINGNANAGFNHQSFKPKHPSSGGGSSKKGSNSSDSSGSSSKLKKNKNGDKSTAMKRANNLQTTIPMMVSHQKKASSRAGTDQVLVPMQFRDASPGSMVMPVAAQNFLMRSPTVRRMQGLATNASDWFKYTLRAYPSNAAMHRGQRRRRLFLGDTVPVASQLSTSKRGIEEQLAAANEPDSPATLAVGCPHHAFRAVEKLKGRGRIGADRINGLIEEKCLHCARLLATIQQTRVQYLVRGGDNNNRNEAASEPNVSTKQQRSKASRKDDDDCFVPPSLIRALAEQLDQANAESNYVALGPEWLQQHLQQQSNDDRELIAASSSAAAAAVPHYKTEQQRTIRSMRTFGVMDRERDDREQQRMTTGQDQRLADNKDNGGGQIPVGVLGRFAYQSNSQLDTPTPYDARCSSMISSSQMDGSEDTNGHYARDGVFILVPDDSGDSDCEGREPNSVLLNMGAARLAESQSEILGGGSHGIADDNESSKFADQQEESIRMQDECSRSSSPVAYGFMRNSGPSSLASSGATQNTPSQPSNRNRSNNYPYKQLSASINQHHSPPSSNNNNNDNIVDNYSVVRKKVRDDNYHQDQNVGPTSSATNDQEFQRQQQQQQVIISRL